MTRERKLRRLLCEIGKKVYASGYVAANDGNHSVRLNSDMILITPTNVSKGAMTPKMIAKISPSGISRDKNQPTSEYRLHLAIYKQWNWINAIIHTHPPYATAWAITGQGLSAPILPEAVLTIGQIPLVRYESPATQELADLVAAAIKEHDVVIMQNHGLVAVGRDLMDAFYKTERAEHIFRIMTIAKQLGEIRHLNPAEIEELYRLYNVPERYRINY
ncbi:MAG: class II aldolase/adducin family protein [Candidatus Marinimicrobia bacterium]|jgi:L-fuculose-phosphate aldolase|nr:class II aldolase/adducin family protein [Candidatus Neomarinimicrobiota bacterium]MCK9559214.1 class II aldolase/adducin family protein [Candidatus Neomarinimicrobiota bacterium]